MTLSKQCTLCKMDKEAVAFYKATMGKLGLSSRCKECEKIYQRSRKQEKHESHKKWWNSEKGFDYKTQKRNETKQRRLDELVEKIETLNKNSVEVWRSGHLKRNVAKLKATPNWVDKQHKEKVTKIYAITQQLQEATGSVYHVDHIVPLISESVCGLHVWWNLQPLPEKTNVTKNNIFNPAIFPEQGEVAFPRWGRINAVQQLQNMETSDD